MEEFEDLPTLEYNVVLDLNTGYGPCIIKRGSDLRHHGIDAPNKAYVMSRCKTYLVEDLKIQGFVPLAKYKNLNNQDGILVGIPLPDSDSDEK